MIMTKRAAENCLSNRALAFSIEALLAKDGPKIQKTREREDDYTTPQNFQDENCKASRSSHGANSSETPFPGYGVEGNRIQVELQGEDLWTRFHKIGNEMIITKSGRRIFPALRVRVSGLIPECYYIMWVDIVPVGHIRYRYVYHSSQWVVAGTGEGGQIGSSMYVHPDSPSPGRHWQSQIVTFDKLKLTNSKNPLTKGQIALNSMHKYQPRIHIQRTFFPNSDPWQQADETKAQTFTFAETEFVTVTAYQNQQITRLKIASNPFAKGFREVLKGGNRKATDEGSRREVGDEEEVKNEMTYPVLRDVFYAPGTPYRMNSGVGRVHEIPSHSYPNSLYQPYFEGYSSFPTSPKPFRTVSSCTTVPSCYDPTYASSSAGALGRTDVSTPIYRTMDMDLCSVSSSHVLSSKNKHLLNVVTLGSRWKSSREERKPTARVMPILLRNNSSMCLQEMSTAWFTLEGKESRLYE